MTHAVRVGLAAALTAAAVIAAPGAARADGGDIPNPFASPTPTPTTPPPTPGHVCALDVPATVAVSARRTTVPLTLGPDCPVGAWAGWDIVDPTGRRAGRVTLTPGRSATFTLTAARPLGTYRFSGVTAWSADYTQVPQTHPTMTVGARSRTAVTASRARSSVTAVARTTTFDLRRGAFTARPRATATLQRSGCASGCRWVTVARGVTDARGVVHLRATAGTRTYWRTVVSGTPTAFGSVSAPFAR